MAGAVLPTVGDTFGITTPFSVDCPKQVHAKPGDAEIEFFVDNLLVRIHFIIVIIRWTGLAPREFEFPFPGSLSSTFL